MTVQANPWVVLAVISGALAMVGVDMTVLNVALPTLAHELGATTSEKLWMVNAYSLVMAGLLPGFGALADRVGHRTMLLAGATVFGLSSALAAFSPSAGVLIAARGLLAVGAAMMLPATLSTVRIVFTRERERALAIGVWGAVWAGSGALGPVLGGFLLEHFWWGSIFLINVPIMLVTLALTLACVPHLPGNPARHWDALASAVLTVALVASLYAIKALLKSDIHVAEVAVALAAGVAAWWLFLRRQRGLPSPLIDFTLFRHRQFALGAAAALVTSFVLMGLQYVVSQELQLVRAFSPLQAGLFVLPVALGAFVAGPAVGSVLMRVGIERMLAATLAMAVLGVGLYAYGVHGATALWEGTLLAMIGVGIGGAMSVASTAIMVSAPEDKAGMAGSTEAIAYELGGTLGVAVMGSVIATVYARRFTPPEAASLPPQAWDSLDQALLAINGLAGTAARGAVEAGKAAFLNGASVALCLAAVVLAAFLAVALVHALRGGSSQKA